MRRTRLIRTILVATSLSAVAQSQDAPPPAAQRDTPNAVDRKLADEQAEWFQQVYSRAWSIESKRIQKLLAVTPEALQGMDTRVHAAIHRLAQNDSDRGNHSVHNNMMLVQGDFAQAIQGAIGEQLGDDARMKYAADLQLRNQLVKDLAVNAVATFLADAVAVDEIQLRDLAPLLKAHVDAQWMIAARSRGTPPLSPQLQQLLKAQLTPLQQKAFDAVSARSAPVGIPVRPQPDQRDREDTERKARQQFAEQLDAAAAAHLETLQRIIGLDAQQTTKLKFLLKVCKQEVGEHRADVRQQVWQVQFGGVDAPPDPRVFEEASMSPGAALVSHERWRLFVPKLLSEEQRKKYKAIRQRAALRRKEQLSGFMAVGIGQQYHLTGAQVSQYKQLCDQTLPATDSASQFSDEFIGAFLKLPSDKVRELIGDENMEDWNRQLEGVIALRKAREQATRSR